MSDHDGHTIALGPSVVDYSALPLEHTGCDTEECCGTCDTEVLQDTAKARDIEIGVRLVRCVLEHQTRLGTLLDTLNRLSMRLDKLGASSADFDEMVREALKRHGVPAEHADAAFAEMQEMYSTTSSNTPKLLLD